MSIAGLTAVEGSANNYVKTYCSHNYPQSASTANLATLMGHSNIKSQISGFSSEITAAASQGKPHIFGETNSGKLTFRYSTEDEKDSLTFALQQPKAEVVLAQPLEQLFGSWTMLCRQ